MVQASKCVIKSLRYRGLFGEGAARAGRGPDSDMLTKQDYLVSNRLLEALLTLSLLILQPVSFLQHRSPPTPLSFVLREVMCAYFFYVRGGGRREGYLLS